MRKKCRIDPSAVVLHADPQAAVSVEDFDVDAPASLRELDRVCQQIPDNLLQSLRVTVSESS